ncbi:MAG: type II toxin-antitoxin system HigB family toxin [Chloroflexi bacterium]|nr:type II toxin-antitoxin system HigB family toxin [Chloroflexota bacterium]
MNLVGKTVLSKFGGSHSDAARQIKAWIAEVEAAIWKTPNDVKARYVSASFLGDNRVIFNIKGNKYRIDAKINYEPQIVLVKRIGTHKDYKNVEVLRR